MTPNPADAQPDDSYGASDDPGARGPRGGAQATGHVHRLDGPARPAPPGLRDRRQLGRRGAGRLLRPHRGHHARRRRRARRRQRPRHPGRHAPRRGQVDRRGRPDGPARRRQVRRRRLRGLRRPARRRHLGGQRALERARRRGPPPGQRLPPELHRRRPGRARSPRARRTDETGTTITFWPNAEIFETVEFDYETLRARFQQMAFLNKGLRITLTDERAAATTTTAEPASRRLPLREGPGRLRRVPQRGQEGRDRCTTRSSPSSRRTPSSKISLEVAMQWTTAYPRASTPTRTRSTPTRAAPTKRASARR